MRSRVRRLAVAGLVLARACVVGIYGWGWWTTARDRESTDNAYVRGDVTAVGPKVAGYVADVPVDDNQTVEAGTVLVRIDDSDFRAQVDRARAAVAQHDAAAEHPERRKRPQRAFNGEAEAERKSGV